MTLIPNIIFATTENIQEANVPVTHLYAPAGFDSNDHSEVVLTGYLPNLCYKIPRSYVEIVGNKISVGMKAQINMRSNQYCADVIIPFIETVKIGQLFEGSYQLTVNENSRWEKNAEMKVAYASGDSVQEAIYANVSEIVNLDHGRRVLLKGYNPSDCYALDKIAVIDNGLDVYSILPKVKKVKDSCPINMTEFSYEFTVPKRLPADTVLLHVRVMDGRSMNALYNNKNP